MRHRRQSTELFNLIFALLIVIFAFSGCSSDKSDISSENVSQTVSVIGETEEVEEVHEPVIKTALIDFTGDLMVHSYQYEESYDPSTGTYEFDHNFQAVKKYFSSADYTVGNLETVLGGDEIGAQDYPCFNTPDSFAQAAKDRSAVPKQQKTEWLSSQTVFFSYFPDYFMPPFRNDGFVSGQIYFLGCRSRFPG